MTVLNHLTEFVNLLTFTYFMKVCENNVRIILLMYKYVAKFKMKLLQHHFITHIQLHKSYILVWVA